MKVSLLSLLLAILPTLLAFPHNVIPNHNLPHKRSVLINNFEFAFDLIHEIVKKHSILQKFTIITDNPSKANEISIFFQEEHSIFYDHLNATPKLSGKVPVMDYPNETYRVHVNKLDYSNRVDIVVEYSLPNIYNYETSGHYPDVVKKMVYVPPLMFPYFKDEPDYNEEHPLERNYNIATTIINYHMSGRRWEKLEYMRVNQTLEFTNFARSFSHQEQHDMFGNIKVLINMHQSPYYHTLEEFRLIPALLRGVVIVSEDVPLRELVPYSKYIVWCKLDQLYETVSNVSNHYDYYYNLIHGKDSGLRDIFRELRANASAALEAKLLEVAERKYH